MKLLLRWVANTVAILVAAYLIPAIEVTSIQGAVVAALVLGVLNTVVRPIFVVFTLPITILTLGLFVLVVNGFVLEILDWLMGEHFVVQGFLWAVVGAIVISIATTIVNIVLGTDSERRRYRRAERR